MIDEHVWGVKEDPRYLSGNVPMVVGAKDGGVSNVLVPQFEARLLTLKPRVAPLATVLHDNQRLDEECPLTVRLCT